MTDSAGADFPPTTIDDVVFTFDFDRPQHTKAVVTATVHGHVLHRDTFNVESANSRTKFLRPICNRLLEQFGVSTTPDVLDVRLLESSQSSIHIEDQSCDASIVPAQAQFQAIDIPGADYGVHRATGPLLRITNFIPVIDRQATLFDAGVQTRQLIGRIQFPDREIPWEIDAKTFASDQGLKASLYETAGAAIEIYCRMDELRNAIAAISDSVSVEAITDFGWSEDLTEFRVPGGVISADGWKPAEDGGISVDLAGTDIASQLGLQSPDESVVQELKAHMIPALLEMAPRSVMYPLLAMLWLPILAPFLSDARPFCLWLVGNSGVGKSYLARIIQRFYGTFRSFLSWTSTSNSLQMAGYYFRHAIALIDDFKPEVTRQTDVVRLIQNYADGSARGRLRKDASANWSRPFRGWIMSTGEDLPEHTPSMLARCVLVRVPSFEKNLELAQVCTQIASKLPQLTAAFVAHILHEERAANFSAAVERVNARLHHLLSGHENGARIAMNYAMLEAAFGETIRFLFDDQPTVDRMIREMSELVQTMISDIVNEIQTQAPHEVFFDVLRSLYASGRVRIQDAYRPGQQDSPSGVMVIGRRSPRGGHLIEINVNNALEAVTMSLRAQGKPGIPTSKNTLYRTFRQHGLLHDQDGEPIDPNDEVASPTYQSTIENRNLRCIVINQSLLGIVVQPRPLFPHIPGQPGYCPPTHSPHDLQANRQN